VASGSSIKHRCSKPVQSIRNSSHMTNGFQKKIKKRTDTLVQKKYLVQLNISALNTHLKTN